MERSTSKKATNVHFVLNVFILVYLVPFVIGGCQSTDECLALLHQDEFYINGSWVQPATPQTTMQVINPSTAQSVGTISLASSQDVDVAVSAAREAFESWSQETSLQTRKSLVEKLLELYLEHQEEMAFLISTEMGAPIDMALDSQASSGSYHIEVFLDSLEFFQFERIVPGDNPRDPESLILMEPIGVVALITPWNWPMNQVTLKVIPALLVGCTCVLKPSELAPLSSLLFADLIHKAGFPPGVFNMMNGNGVGAGAYLSQHVNVDMVSFTGSKRVGVIISQAAAETHKRVRLELGGKGANIIFQDAHPDVVEHGVWDCFSNSGQSCNAPTRMLVERSIYQDAVETAIRVANEAEVKPAHVEGEDHIGPVVGVHQYEKIQNYIAKGVKEGATLVAGGLGRPNGLSDGFFVKPTVFANVNNSMSIMQDEIFGPVLCIMPFDTEEEALAIANDSPYGLTHYVHSSNGKRLNRMARKLKSGMVQMNGMGGADGAPFGGVKASGNAREGGVWGLEEFCEIKAISGWDPTTWVESKSESLRFS